MMVWRRKCFYVYLWVFYLEEVMSLVIMFIDEDVGYRIKYVVGFMQMWYIFEDIFNGFYL